MRIEYIDDILTIYLKGIYTDDINNLCLNTLNKLKKYYNIDLKGFYIINVYIDKKYGIIMDIETEDDIDIEYDDIEYYIITYNNTFLYEVEDILDLNIDKYYTYNEKYYIDIDSIYNIEFIKVIYKDTINIINNIVCKLCK